MEYVRYKRSVRRTAAQAPAAMRESLQLVQRALRTISDPQLLLKAFRDEGFV